MNREQIISRIQELEKEVQSLKEQLKDKQSKYKDHVVVNGVYCNVDSKAPIHLIKSAIADWIKRNGAPTEGNTPTFGINYDSKNELAEAFLIRKMF